MLLCAKFKNIQKSKINFRNGQNYNFEAKIMHFLLTLREKDQTLYHFQLYDLVQKRPSQARRWPTGLVAMRHLKKKKKKKKKKKTKN